MIRRTLLTLAAAAATLLTLTQPAHAGTVTRTFTGYDLTQCSCTYSNGFAFVHAAPTVTAQSYYDTTVQVEVPTYQRVTANLNTYKLADPFPSGAGGYQITFNPGTWLIVMCWTDNTAGVQMDKVSGWPNTNVNGQARRVVAYVDDRQIPDYVRLAGHHC